MTWTKTRPTALGWYWCRLHIYDKVQECVVEVIAIYRGNKISVAQLTEDEVCDDNTEWSSCQVPYPSPTGG